MLSENKKFISLDKICSFLIWAIYLVIFVRWITTGMDLSGDAGTYINMSVIRTPGYPIFIKLTTLFGLIKGYRVTSFIAMAFGIFILHRFCRFLKDEFALNNLFVLAISLCLLFPYYYLDIQNGIFSETLAYPLFVLSVHLLCRTLITKNLKTAPLYFISTAVLLLVRPQFIFMHAVSGLAILYLILCAKKPARAYIPVIGIFVLSIIGENLFERTYHLALHKHFGVPSFFGVQFDVLPLYNLEDKDVALFTDSLQHGVIDTVISYEKNSPIYTLDNMHSHANTDWAVFKYSHVYNMLSWKTSEHFILNYWLKKNPSTDEYYFWTYLNNVTSHIAFTLIKAHPKDYLILYFIMLNSSFGYINGFVPFMIFFVISFIMLVKYNTKESLILFLGCLLVLLNHTLICFFEPPIGRYLIYTYAIFPTFVFVALFKFMTPAQKPPVITGIEEAD